MLDIEDDLEGNPSFNADNVGKDLMPLTPVADERIMIVVRCDVVMVSSF